MIFVHIIASFLLSAAWLLFWILTVLMSVVLFRGSNRIFNRWERERIRCLEETVGSHGIGQKLRISSYNIRGCNDADKRRHTLNDRGIHVACLQETKLVGGSFQSDNYAWSLCYDEEKVNTDRGTAILISSKTQVCDLKFYSVSGNIFDCSIKWMNEVIHVVNVYMPSDSTSSSNYIDLGAYILKINCENVVLLGDFNAHIGKGDKTSSDSASIGNNLFHDILKFDKIKL